MGEDKSSKKSKSLKFKGERSNLQDQKKKEKSRKRKAEAMEAADTIGEGQFGGDEIDGWVPTPSASLLLGPINLTLPISALPTHLSSPPPTGVCLGINPTLSTVILPSLPSVPTSAAPTITPTDLAGLDLPSDATLSLSTSPSSASPTFVPPTSVHHVFVCTRILDSEDKITLRSSANRYLSSSEIGEVTCASEARGVQEEWTLVPLSSDAYGGGNGWVGLQNHYGKFLTVDETVDGRLEARADGEEPQGWRAWMQADKLPTAKPKDEGVRGGKKRKAGLEGVEEEEIRKAHTRGSGRFVGSTADVGELKKAKKDGDLREKMLDRRMKVKHDRYC
ncbi:hypothetical protein BT69DRAFT_1351868 [Atractiella rhizophila]|nr:hypothetical protein BT69DRAFT_1351868 [Atractiella rhizophila]